VAVENAKKNQDRRRLIFGEDFDVLGP